MKKLLYIPLYILAISLFIQCSSDDNPPVAETVTDADGNVYATIKIGNQTWMVENLKTTKYNDGTPITEYQFGDNWSSLSDQNAYYQ